MHSRSGITLIEVVVAAGIVGILTLITIYSMDGVFANQRLKGAARDAADIVMLARSEAIRSGDRHVLFFGPLGSADPDGTPLQDAAGGVAMLVALDDGPAATSNCRIDAGEAREAVSVVAGVTPGVSLATVKHPDDAGSAPFAPPQASGNTYADPANNPVNWVLFRPDGIPVPFDAAGTDCGAMGPAATGGAALYLTNGERDYVVVITPLGGVRVHAWDEKAGGWSS